MRIRFTFSLIFFLFILAGLPAKAQEIQHESDSLMMAKLMQDNLDLYYQIDSLDQLLKEKGYKIPDQKKELDSLQAIVNRLQSEMVISNVKVDTLTIHKLRLTRELMDTKQQMLKLNSSLDQQLQLVREKDYKLSDCLIKLKELQADASLSQARLEGKNEVNNTLVAAKQREVDYLQNTITEKNKIISEKTAELSQYYNEKSNSLKIVDSLSRTLNQKELEFVKVSERLKLIEGQYNQMVEQKAAAQNRKKKIRFVQGVGLKGYRTPDWQLAPQSSSTTSIYVITNKNAGKLEFDYITGVSLSLYDLSQDDGKFTYDAGLYVGFGGTNLFKNFYIAPSFKAFDFFHFMLGCNIAEYQLLQSGFNIGDVLPGGMSIPTVKTWKANFFLGMTIDFELLANIPKKM